MKSYEWDLAKKMFVEVDNPTYDPKADGVSEAITNAGYFVEFASGDESDVGGHVTIYGTQDPSKPRFYIDIMGQNTGIATLVARDFIALVETLHRIHPLLTFAGLEQVYTARVADQVEREEQARK
ncbi:MAG TPA: hypothetical protein VF450_21220 [Noviherbaspirillum sp.]